MDVAATTAACPKPDDTGDIVARLNSDDLKRNYYELLGVDPKAPDAIMRAAYRTMMGELGGHPDVGGSNDRAVLLNRAKEVLLDHGLRAEYDRRRGAARHPSAAPDQSDTGARYTTSHDARAQPQPPWNRQPADEKTEPAGQPDSGETAVRSNTGVRILLYVGWSVASWGGILLLINRVSKYPLLAVVLLWLICLPGAIVGIPVMLVLVLVARMAGLSLK